MKLRRLGREGPTVSALGLGCMGMSQSYGVRDDQESIRAIHHALDLQINFLDTADIYGEGHNEELIGRAIRDRRQAVFLATKFGFVLNAKNMTVDGRPEYVREACDASLRRLGTDVIDLYYLHRVDPQVRVEETWAAMAELVRAGKVRYLGLSEVSAETLGRAARIHPITALQSEYSLWSREVEPRILPACRDLGIGFVAFSPLGRGMFTGRIRSEADFSETDARKNFPRFQGENFERNLALAQRFEQMAVGKRCTTAQLALAWLVACGEDIVPIPGTKRRAYIEENIGALAVELTAEDLARIDELAPPDAAAGDRYNEEAMRLVEG